MLTEAQIVALERKKHVNACTLRRRQLYRHLGTTAAQLSQYRQTGRYLLAKCKMLSSPLSC